MVIKIERAIDGGKEFKLSVITNDTAHSVLSDNPELQQDIIDSINTQLNYYLREKKKNNGGVYNKKKKAFESADSEGEIKEEKKEEVMEDEPDVEKTSH